MKKFLKALATTILTIVLFLSTLTLLLIVPIRRTINDNVIKEIISSIDIEKEVAENPQFKEQIEQSLEPVYEVTREIGLDDEVTLKILNIKEVKELVGDVTNNLLSTIITGEAQELITAENVQNIVSEAIDDVNNSGIYEISPEIKKEIMDVVETESTTFEKIIPDTTKVLNELPQETQNYLDIVHFILSTKFLTYIICSLAISLVLIILLNLTRFKWLKVSAVTVLISSIFSLIITAFISLYNMTYLKTNYSYIANILTKLLNFSYLISIITFVSMIILLIIYHFIKRKRILKNSDI